MLNPLLTVRSLACAIVRPLRTLSVRLALAALAGAGAQSAHAQGPLQWWSLKLNEQDSAAVRSSAVTPSTATLRRLVFSNGTTVAAYPAHSARYGQAIAPTPDGSWTVANGGPGNNLDRRYYEQFTLTAAAASSVRVDSITLWSAFYNTTGKLAVVYSRSGFTATGSALDSVDVSAGGRGPSGTLAASNNGAFGTPVALLNQNTGTNQTYRFALGSSGVALAAGQTLTVRVYLTTSSTSSGRYALLKDVVLKGVNTTSACNATFAYGSSSFCQSGTNPTPTITGTAGGTFSSTTGLSIGASTGTINLAASTPGTYTVTYAASATCSSTSTVTISSSQSAAFSYGATSYCSSAAGQLPTLGTGATAGTFSSTTGLTINASTGAITPSSSTPGTYTVTNTVAASGSCAAATATTTVTITAQPTANIGYGASGYCTSTAGTVALGIGTGSTRGTITVNPATGLTIDATGAITPSTSTPGTYFVTNTVAASGGCAAVSGGTTVTITAPQTAGFSYGSIPFCTSQTTATAPTLATGATAGTFSSTTGLTLNATTGAITPSTSTPGTYTVTNSLAANGACAATSSTATVTIAPATSAAFAYSGSTFCLSGTNPTPTITGTTGGTFTVSPATGLTISGNTGTITLSSSTAGTYTVTYTVAGTCGSSSTATVTVTSAPSATFSYGATSYCTTATTPTTPTFPSGSSGGTFSSTTGLSLNASTGAITPSTSTAGTYTVTNTIPAASGCTAATATTTVTIVAPATAGFSYGAASYCTTATSAAVPTLAGGASAGTFSSTTGLTINASTGAITPSSSTPGTYTVTNTVAASGSCAAVTGTATVTITAPPLANIGYGASGYCTSTAGTVALGIGTGSTRGTITVNPATGLTIDATGAITPSTSTPGTYFVTNTVAASGGCAAVSGGTTVTITAPQTAGFSYGSTPFCVNGSTNPTPTLTTGATAGTFSSTAGLTINATTGAITLASSTPGTYTVTNTVAASGGCAAVSSTATVTISAAPSAAFTYANAAYCAGGNAAAATVTGATGGTFSVAPATGLVVNATTGALTLAGATAGTYTVTYSVTGACSASSTRTVTINPVPAAPTLTTSGTPATGITLTSSAATGNQFYLNGVAVAGATGQTYLVNSGTLNGSYTVTTTNSFGCTSAASPAVTVTVTAARNAATGPEISLYPNPTPTGKLEVAFGANNKALELTVLNALGQVVLRRNVAATSQQLTLDLSALPSGVYVLQGRTTDGTSVRRFVRE